MIAKMPQRKDGAGTERPLYKKVADDLLEAIRRGDHQVGGLLPPEAALAASLGVSRQTVRRALAELRNANMISAKRGVGNRIESTERQRRFHYSSKSLDDLIHFATDTRLSLVTRQRFLPSLEVATELGIVSGRPWLHLGCIRVETVSGAPFCWTDIYLDDRFSQILGSGETVPTPLFSRIEDAAGERLCEIHQDIRAVKLGSAIAARFGETFDSPALQVTRRYYLSEHQLAEVSVNTVPADRWSFSLEMDLTR